MRLPYLLFYICVFLTGASALVLQILWNRYLSYLIGGDSLAQALCVGIFLAGLSTGYFVWGQSAQALKKKHTAIYLYAACELVIGLWCFAFSNVFQQIQKLHALLPQGVITDLFASSVLVALPAFFMGGTIPLLTRSLPNQASQIGRVHAKIYGFNTLGAGFGAIVGGFVLLPVLGLSASLLAVGIVNLSICLAVILIQFSSSAFNDSLQAQQNLAHQNFSTVAQFSAPKLYLTAFLSGLWIIGFEVLCFRFVALSLGSSLYLYPMVVSFFVIGLGTGALSTSCKSSNNESSLALSLPKSIGFAAFLFCLTLFAVPYLNVWVNASNQILRELSFGYELSFVVHFLVYSLLILPILFFAGRILPLVYSAFPKNNDSYAKSCGNLYFLNTIGSLFGSVGIGYFGYQYFSIEQLLKALIFLGIALWLTFLSHRKYFRFKVAALTASLAVIWFPLNRSTDILTLDAYPSTLSLFKVPQPNVDLVSLSDETLATISIVKHPSNKSIAPPPFNDSFFYSLHLNGKNESSTYPDFLSTSQLALLPYIFSHKKKLNVAVVGLGTGATAGLLGQLDNVESVTVLEISNGLIEAGEMLKSHNFDVLNNKKIQIVKKDAFRFFRENRKQFDIIISEPSSIWNLGNETLYSIEFYRLVKKSLTADGIFMNWMHLYNNNKKTVFQSLNTQFHEFEQSRGFILAGGVDLGILATPRATNLMVNQENFNEPLVNQIMKYFGFFNSNSIHLNEVFDWTHAEFNFMNQHFTKSVHSLDYPTLAFQGYRGRFYKQDYSFFKDQDLLRAKKSSHKFALFSDAKSRALMREFKMPKKQFIRFCKSKTGSLKNPMCHFVMFLYLNHWQAAVAQNSSINPSFLGLIHYGSIPSNSDVSILRSKSL